jgi:hypothetical protein
MRCLKLVVTAQGGWSSIVFAAVLPLGVACGGQTESANGTARPSSGSSGGAGTGTGGVATSRGGVGTNMGGQTVGLGGAAGRATGGADTTWAQDTTTTTVPASYPYAVVTNTGECWNAIVPLPPEGTPPSPADLCSAATGDVESGWAARVTLGTNAQDPLSAVGHITIAPELAASVVGMPTVSVVESDVAPVTVGSVVVSAGGGGFDFGVFFGQTPNAPRYPLPQRIVVAVGFTVDCGDTMRQVRALTALYYCFDWQTYGWASSGDRCLECDIICEMVASPILPSPGDGPMALGSAVRMAIRVVGRVRDALLLLAEHDGGPDRFDYEWSAVGGQLVWAERDVALWVPPPTSEQAGMVQVAALSEDAAAVASWRWSFWV